MANEYQLWARFMENLPALVEARDNARIRQEYLDLSKQKYADSVAQKEHNQNVIAWTQMQNFAQEMPFGQQANFLRKQLDTLPQDFIESQNLDKFIDNYGIVEENEVNQRGIFDNIMDEDNPNKIRFSVDYLEDPRRKKQALSQAKRLESEYGKQKPFDINKLTLKEQTDYKTYSKFLNDSRAALAQMSLPGLSEEQKREYKKSLPYQEALKNVPFLQAQLDPLIKKGAPITMPEFNYSPESLKALTDDPDLMSSFLAAPEDDMDAFYNVYKNPDPTLVPTPVPTPAPTPKSKPKTEAASMWEPVQSTIFVEGADGEKTQKIVHGGFHLKPGAPDIYQGEKGKQFLQKEMAELRGKIKNYKKNITDADNQIKSIDNAIGKLSGKTLKAAEKQRELYLRRRNKAAGELDEVQTRYDFIKKPTWGDNEKKKT